jgi:hypothetical protein
MVSERSTRVSNYSSSNANGCDNVTGLCSRHVANVAERGTGIATRSYAIC